MGVVEANLAIDEEFEQARFFSRAWAEMIM